MGEMIDTYLLTDNISKEKFICVKDEAWPEMETAIVNYPELFKLAKAVVSKQMNGTEKEYIEALSNLSEFLEGNYKEVEKSQKPVVWVKERENYPGIWFLCDEDGVVRPSSCPTSEVSIWKEPKRVDE